MLAPSVSVQVTLTSSAVVLLTDAVGLANVIYELPAGRVRLATAVAAPGTVTVPVLPYSAGRAGLQVALPA